MAVNMKKSEENNIFHKKNAKVHNTYIRRRLRNGMDENSEERKEHQRASAK
jgi:hypothetical protein